MQTFLPYADFLLSARTLDKKRCWKQVVEARQIITILEQSNKIIKKENKNCIITVRKIPAWSNHPAVKMWEGYLPVLKYYYNEFLIVSIEKHKINTKLKPFTERKGGLPFYPFWYGNEDFHRAMRARLIEKDREFYLPLFPDDEGFNNGKYFWPDMQTKTFKII
jgi:hypothetical protein